MMLPDFHISICAPGYPHDIFILIFPQKLSKNWNKAHARRPFAEFIKSVGCKTAKGTIAQEAYDMGYKAVDAVVRSLNGETLDKFIDSGCSVVTPENAQERLDQLKGYLE